MLNAEELKEKFIYCIKTGDQETWNLIYPQLIEHKFNIDSEILEYFSHSIS